MAKKNSKVHCKEYARNLKLCTSIFTRNIWKSLELKLKIIQKKSLEGTFHERLLSFLWLLIYIKGVSTTQSNISDGVFYENS